MDEDHQDGSLFFIKDEQKWLEIEKAKLENEKFNTERYIEFGNGVISAYKEYVSSGRRTITIASFIFIGLIFVSMAFLTFYGKLNGETFAFVTGTIVGYIINLLK
jgi:hypothetical protein